MKKVFSNRIVSVVSSVTVSVMAVALVGYAATTISTNINTAGTLTVSGASTLTGAITASGGLTLDSTSATTTISGGLRADTGDNTLVVDFSSSRVGIATTSPSVLLSVHGNSILGSANASVVAFRAGDIRFTSEATTTVAMSANGINVASGALILDTASTTVTRLSVGTSTPLRGTLGIHTGSGTSTIAMGADNAGTGASIQSRGSCIEMKTSQGVLMRLTATSSTNFQGAFWENKACDQ